MIPVAVIIAIASTFIALIAAYRHRPRPRHHARCWDHHAGQRIAHGTHRPNPTHRKHK